MAETDFLVTLPSNSNMTTHPSNEPANYTVKLASPISLTGDWEAALVSVQYSPTWMTFQNRVTLALFAIPDANIDGRFIPSGTVYTPHANLFTVAERYLAVPGKTYGEIHQSIIQDEKIPKEFDFKVVHVLPRYYATSIDMGEEVCRVVNLAVKNIDIFVRYDYDYTTKRGVFSVSGGSLGIYAENYMILGELLGHESRFVHCGMCANYSQRQHASSHYFKLALGSYKLPKLPKVTSLWVYTNITEYQQVGDTKAPLLGIIPAQGTIGQRTHYTINPVHFLALNRNHIAEINIRITDDKGQRIPFLQGSDDDNVVCCVRFRRRKIQQYV